MPSPPHDYVFGNSSVGNVDGPGYFNIDSALSKRNRLTESSYLEFRWEMFNALNRSNLNNPVQNVNDVNLGEIFGSSPARRMQFGLKIIF